MQVISRKNNQRVMLMSPRLSEDIVVTIVDVRPKSVRIGIEFPRDEMEAVKCEEYDEVAPKMSRLRKSETLKSLQQVIPILTRLAAKTVDAKKLAAIRALLVEALSTLDATSEAK